MELNGLDFASGPKLYMDMEVPDDGRREEGQRNYRAADREG